MLTCIRCRSSGRKACRSKPPGAGCLRRSSKLEKVGNRAGAAAFFIDMRTVCRYYAHVIKSYRHKGIKEFAETGSKAGIQPEHANRLKRLLFALDAAACPSNMNAPSYGLHRLKGGLEGHWAVRVSGNWRLTFGFEGEDAVLVDYQDY